MLRKNSESLNLQSLFVLRSGAGIRDADRSEQGLFSVCDYRTFRTLKSVLAECHVRAGTHGPGWSVGVLDCNDPVVRQDSGRLQNQ